MVFVISHTAAERGRNCMMADHSGDDDNGNQACQLLICYYERARTAEGKVGWGFEDIRQICEEVGDSNIQYLDGYHDQGTEVYSDHPS